MVRRRDAAKGSKWKINDPSTGKGFESAVAYMGFAREIADRMCFLEQGVVLEEGPPEQLFTSPREKRRQQCLQRVVAPGRLAR